jgi:hypothetical protein
MRTGLLLLYRSSCSGGGCLPLLLLWEGWGHILTLSLNARRRGLVPVLALGLGMGTGLGRVLVTVVVGTLIDS